jgi:DNA-binding FadR family transcriptional regulator
MQILIGEIVTGALAEGESLPREADLAKQYEVSRGVARESLRGLEERGLIAVKHGRGAKVSPSADWDVLDPDVLTGLLSNSASASVLREFLECRRILEIEAARLAAERATDDDLAALSEAYERMASVAERARLNPAAENLYQEADIAFHRAIIDATENRALGRMTEPIHRALTAAIRPLARPQFRVERALPEHERILDAIKRRDAHEAGKAMEDHLSTVERYVDEYLEEADGSPKRGSKRRRQPRKGRA